MKYLKQFNNITMKQSNITPEVAARIVYELDQYARQYNESEYGLPVYNEGAKNEMAEIVLKISQEPKIYY